MTEIHNSNLNTWSELDCNKLKIWFEKIKARQRAHHCASYWNNIINRLLTYTSFLISAIISTISLNITNSPSWLLPCIKYYNNFYNNN